MIKLRNKKTGEIRKAVDIDMYSDFAYLKVCDGEFGNETIAYHSLAELNAEWEDYEEPKEYWYIYADGDIYKDVQDDVRKDNGCKEIGNYFETKEEAEKAVEKLKALKRLKDNGMIKYSFHKEKTGIDLDFYTLTILAPRDKDSLDLLFGGENER